MDILNEIETTIKHSLPDAEVYVRDPQQDGQHFEALVVSPQFEGMPLIKQHKMVMNALKEQLKETVHALALKTMTPKQWETN